MSTAIIVGTTMGYQHLSQQRQDRHLLAQGEAALAVLTSPHSAPRLSTWCDGVTTSVGTYGFADTAEAIALLRADAEAYEAADWKVHRYVDGKYWYFAASRDGLLVSRNPHGASFGCRSSIGDAERVESFPRLVTRPDEDQWARTKQLVLEIAAVANPADRPTSSGRLVSDSGDTLCWSETFGDYPLRSGPRTGQILEDLGTRLEAEGWTVDLESPAAFSAYGASGTLPESAVLVESDHLETNEWALWKITFTDRTCGIR